MSPIAAKMHGDTVSTGLFADDSGRDNARLDSFAGLAYSGDVGDVDVELCGYKSCCRRFSRESTVSFPLKLDPTSVMCMRINSPISAGRNLTKRQ